MSGWMGMVGTVAVMWVNSLQTMLASVRSETTKCAKLARVFTVSKTGLSYCLSKLKRSGM